ncbi:MAG TPA: HEAT repeat domain-containing protein [Candidatus Sulfopaludibacter sp.]|nr:HEAT repeat domain-containing protein [Candidatus Sulfopaludibacter sp.]
MNCESAGKLIPLYYYGELSPEEEDRVEAHFYECAACAREMEQQRTVAAALDIRRVAPSPALLEDCRADLMAAIQGGAPRVSHPAKGPWTLFLEAIGITFGGLTPYRQPVGAVLLIAVGFFAARITGAGSRFAIQPNGSAPLAYSASMTPDNDVFSTVRSVQPDSSGRVQIAFDETRRRVITGNVADPGIQKYLVAASSEENPAVRVESVGLLQTRADSSEVRDALLNALAHDANAEVRLKALEGLKSRAADPMVRKTLAQVLLADDNAAVRMQAVDLLVARRDDSMVGVLQNLVQRDGNSAVRLKCEKALKDMNASVGTF